MPKILTALCLCLATSLACAGQEAEDYYGPYRFEPGAVQVVFSDTAYVRTAPGGAVQDTLYAFDPVTIRRALPQLLTVGRKRTPWYEVTYQMSGKRRTGCVWGGALAISSAAREGVTFAFGLLSYPQSPVSAEDAWPEGIRYNTAAIKASGGKSNGAQGCLYNISTESQFFTDTGRDEDGAVYAPRFSKATSLPPGTHFLVNFYLGGEACAVPGYQMSAAWDGTRLIRMPKLESEADAGVYSYSEEFRFPAEKGGRPGHLTVRRTTDVYDEDVDLENPKPSRHTVGSKLFRWNAAAGILSLYRLRNKRGILLPGPLVIVSPEQKPQPRSSRIFVQRVQDAVSPCESASSF